VAAREGSRCRALPRGWERAGRAESHSNSDAPHRRHTHQRQRAAAPPRTPTSVERELQIYRNPTPLGHSGAPGRALCASGEADGRLMPTSAAPGFPARRRPAVRPLLSSCRPRPFPALRSGVRKSFRALRGQKTRPERPASGRGRRYVLIQRRRRGRRRLLLRDGQGPFGGSVCGSWVPVCGDSNIEGGGMGLNSP
jgi:hypothetical protein